MHYDANNSTLFHLLLTFINLLMRVMRENIKDRLTKLLATLGLTHEEFQDRCSLGSGFASRISPMTRKASFDKIKNAFPSVNINWLITGKGEMFGVDPSVSDNGVGERLNEFALSLGMNKRQFERAANLSNGYLTKASDTITPKVRLLLSTKFPYLNMDWVLTGTGNMVSACMNTAISVSAKDRLRFFVGEIGIGESRFLARCGIAVKKIDNLPKLLPDEVFDKIKAAYPTLNTNWVITGEGDMITELSTPHNLGIPLVGISIQAAYAERFADTTFIKSLPTIPTGYGQIAFEVSDDAMNNGTPRALLKGDILLCSSVSKGTIMADLSHIGDIAVIVRNGGILIRSIAGCDTTSLSVTFHAYNINYPDITIDMNEIGKFLIAERLLRKV